MPKVLGTNNGAINADYKVIKKDQSFITVKTYKTKLWVLADNVNQTEDDIRATTGVPQLWSVSNGAICKSVRCKEESRMNAHPVTGLPTILWMVTASYDSSLDLDQQQPPVQRRPVVRWSGETEEEVLERDPITGNPVQTDAEEPIIISTPVVLPVLQVERFEFYPFDPDIILDYAHHTNSTVFWGAPPGSALMLPMDVDEETIEEVKYVKVTYKIKFKIKKQGGQMLQNTWLARVLHHGFKYRESAGLDPKIFQDESGNPATVNLWTEENHPGEGGVRVPAGDPAEYKEFNRFTQVDFNNLNLGPF